MKIKNVFEFMDTCVLHKRERGKESTAELYRAGANHLKKYMKKEQMMWEEFTSEMVEQFRDHLMDKGLGVNSVNSYLSCLRAMYNNAIKGEVGQDLHPFAGIRLQRALTEKRAAPVSVIEKMTKLYLGNNPQLQQIVDLYVFSYLACGMPFADLCRLKRENLREGEIVYRRIKTGTLVRISITSGMKKILKRNTCKDSPWLFPILPKKTDVSHTNYKICLRLYNKKLKEVGKMIGIEQTLTSYVVRHSWATDALLNDVPVSVISHALGHTSLKTTQIYLGSLDMEKIRKETWKVTGKVDKLVKEIA